MFMIMTGIRQMSLNRHGNKNKLSNLFTGKIKERALIGSCGQRDSSVQTCHVCLCCISSPQPLSLVFIHPVSCAPIGCFGKDTKLLKKSKLWWMPRCQGPSLPHSGLDYIKPLFPATLQFRQNLRKHDSVFALFCLSSWSLKLHRV